MCRILFSGDFCSKLENCDGISTGILDLLQSADYSIVNCKGPPIGNKEKIRKAGPAIYQHEKSISCLRNMGLDLVLSTNNHIMDYGCIGLTKTIDELRKNGLAFIGAGLSRMTAYEPIVIDFNDIKVGIVNGCEAQFGVLDESSKRECGYAWINHYEIDYQISKLRPHVDVLIVCAHAGLENYELPLYEWRSRYRNLCDLGADYIIACHPHVIQGYEQYGDKRIYYSLGNFYFPSYSNEDIGALLILDISASGVVREEHYGVKRCGIELGLFHESVNRIIPNITSMFEYKNNESLFDRMYKNEFCDNLFPYLCNSLNCFIRKRE
jgi:hypothetical protein